jgi:hypothetical protein
MVDRVKVEVNSSGKVKLSIDDKELELDKKELRILLHEAENALDTLGYLEVKRWNNIIRD